MNAQELFELVDLDWIKRCPPERYQEGLYLEFSEAEPSGIPSRDNLRKLAKSASAFANSQGGVLVWGVRAKRDESLGVDCATELCPFSDPDLFAKRLNEQMPNLMQPFLGGVTHTPVNLDDDTGFVKSLIPTGYQIPYLAGGREGRFYRRSGDQSLRMERFEISEMFNRRGGPHLTLTTNLRAAGSSSGGAQRYTLFKFQLDIVLTNEGRGLASHCFVSLGLTDRRYTLQSLDRNSKTLKFNQLSVPGKHTDQYQHLLSGADISLPPKVSIPILTIPLQVSDQFQQENCLLPDLSLTTGLAADGQALSQGSLEISGEKLLEDIAQLMNWPLPHPSLGS